MATGCSDLAPAGEIGAGERLGIGGDFGWRAGSHHAAAVFAGSYLLSPALEIANLADFHAVAFSSALLLFAFWFVYRRQYPLFWLFALLAMATKEHVPFSVFIMGLYIAFVQKNRTVGYITCGVAAVWAIG